MEEVKTLLAVLIVSAFVVFVAMPAVFGDPSIKYKDAVLGGLTLIGVLVGFVAVLGAVVWAVGHLTY